jgi:hypothetical protein
MKKVFDVINKLEETVDHDILGVFPQIKNDPNYPANPRGPIMVTVNKETVFLTNSKAAGLSKALLEAIKRHGHS